MKQMNSSKPSAFGYYDNYSYRGQERSRLSESGYQQPHRSPYFFYGIPPHVTPSPSHGYPMYGVVGDWVTDILPNDVLSGRGGATNSHSGNRAFRSLVKDYQDQYLKAKKRDKPAVASISKTFTVPFILFFCTCTLRAHWLIQNTAFFLNFLLHQSLKQFDKREAGF